MGGKPRQAFATANLVDHVRKSALCRTGCHWAARWAVRLRTDLPISMRPSRGAAAQAVAHHLGGHSPAVSIVPASATHRTTLGRTNAIPDRRDFTMAKHRGRFGLRSMRLVMLQARDPRSESNFLGDQRSL